MATIIYRVLTVAADHNVPIGTLTRDVHVKHTQQTCQKLLMSCPRSTRRRFEQSEWPPQLTAILVVRSARRSVTSEVKNSTTTFFILPICEKMTIGEP